MSLYTVQDTEMQPTQFVPRKTIDKSHCDQKGGKLSLEPFQFTFAHFRRSLCNQPFAWRVAGLIPNSINLPKTTADKNAIDYHFFLDKVLNQFRSIQKGIAWKLKYGGKIWEIMFKPFILMVIGDTEGHDKLCGRYLN